MIVFTVFIVVSGDKPIRRNLSELPDDESVNLLILISSISLSGLSQHRKLWKQVLTGHSLSNIHFYVD
jgi:hypothetical protein